jgi:hypothetical protein
MSRTRHPALWVEALEARETPHATATLSSGTLTIRGDNLSNNLVIAETATPGQFAVSANGNAVGVFTPSNLSIIMGNGNDTVDLGIKTKLPGSLTVNLGAGNDYFTTKNSKIGAAINSTVSIATGLSTPAGPGLYDEVVELYNLNFNGAITQITGASGSSATQLDIDTAKIAGTLTARNIYATFLGAFSSPANAPMLVNMLIDNTVLNTDGRTDAQMGPGNVVFMHSGSKLTGSFNYNGGAGNDAVYMPGEGGASAAPITINGSVSMLAREGINTLSLGDGTFGAQIGGSVTYTGGSNIDRFFFDSGSTVGGNMNVNLLDGANQVFGDSLGLGAGPFNPLGSALVGGTLSLTLGNGDNFIGTYDGGGTTLTVGGSFRITVGGGTNTGGDAFAPGAITVFNNNIFVAQTISYTAGGGSQTLEISKTNIPTLSIKFGGGANTVNFPITDFFGNATIDFGIGLGPKAFETDFVPTTFHGKLVLMNYP